MTNELRHTETGQPLDRLAFTINETAAMLGISPVSVYRLLKRGLLRSSTALRHKLIPKTEIDRFLKTTLEGARN